MRTQFRFLLFIFLLAALPIPALADYTVTGKLLFEDRDLSVNGFTGAVYRRPIRLADVQIVAVSNAWILAEGATDANGDFSIVVPGSTPQQIRAVCLASSTKTAGLFLEVRVAGSTTTFGSIWSLQSGSFNYSGTSTLPMGEITAGKDTDAGRAFNIWDALIDSAEFTASPGVRGSYPSTLFTIAWSRSPTNFGGYYDPSRKFAYIGPSQAQDDPIIYQQFGHFLVDLYSRLDAPTGFTLFSDDNLDMRAAWAEGISLFIGASIRKFKGYPRPDFYILTDGNAPLLTFDLESLTGYINPMFSYPAFKTNKGGTNMLAVAGALWDITDGASTGDGSPGTDDDALQKDFFSVWRVLVDYILPQSFKGITVERFWDGWFSPSVNNGSEAEMRTIFLRHGIEFVPDSAEGDNSTAQAPSLTAAQLPAPAGGARVRINEISLDDGSAIELYNAGDAEADLNGWFLSAIRGGTTATATLSFLKLRPGEFVTFIGVTGAPGRDRIRFSGTAPIPWLPGEDGACALRDKLGLGQDFVRWGGSQEFPPAGTDFTGANPATPSPGRNLGRNFAVRDTDSGSDWAVQSPSLGGYNLSGEETHRTFFPAGDVDHAAFDARSGLNYLVETLALGNGADTVLEILSPDGSTVLASNDDSGLGNGSRIVWKAPADRKYFIRCRRYDKPTNYVQYGSYDLRVIETSSTLRIVQPDIVTVSIPGQGGQYNTLAEALEAAYSGDTVEIIDSATYQEQNLRISGKSLTVRARPGRAPVIDGRGRNSGTLLINGKDVRIESLTILGGTYGIQVTGGAAAIVNTVVARTSEGSSADGIVASGDGVSTNVIHCTVANNRRYGIGVFNNAKARVVNSIAHGNTQTDIGGDATAAVGLTVKNSLSVRSSYPGSNGNIDGDPLFLDADGNNYRLQPSSPVVDKGDGADPDLPPTDADGLARKLPGSGTSAIPDMGAYEYLNPSILVSTAVFPQIAAGGTSPNPEYRTSIVAANTTSWAIATARVALTQSNGQPFNVTVLNEADSLPEAGSGSTEAGRVLAKSGSSFDVAVLPLGTVRLETAGSTGTVSGYAKLLSNVPLNGTALFKTLQGTTILSEAGVGLSKPAKTFTVYIDNKNFALSGYAVANTGSQPASITMTIRDADGQTRGTAALPILSAGWHFARFASQDFDQVAVAGFEGTIEFQSTQPLSAVALRYDNTNLPSLQQVFSTIPVLVDEAATTLYFPQVADGSGYRTNFILVNPGVTATTAKLEFFDDDGKPLGLPVGGLVKTSHDVPLGSHGVSRFLTDGTSEGVKVGWVKVTCPVPVGGSSIFQTVSGTLITSEAGVASSPRALRFMVYVETVASTLSGLAICNPNDVEVDITLKLRNAAGVQVGTKALKLPARGHVARFFTQEEWFGDNYPDFEGTIEVMATQPVSGVALRYDNPPDYPAFATLPVIRVP